MALCACGKAPAAPPPPAEADPAGVVRRAQIMIGNSPAPGAARACTPADLSGGLTMTWDTLLRLGGKPVPDDPEHAAWMQPPELDAPAAKALVAGGAGTPARRAAATWLGAPFYVVYRVDNVDAPLALGVKELKRSTISARVIRFEHDARPGCVQVFLFQDDAEINRLAIAKSDRPAIDPAVAQAVRDELTKQLLAHAPGSTVPASPP